MIIDLSYTDSVTLWTSIFKVSIFLSETELTRMTQNHAMLSRQLTIFSSNLRCLCVALAPVGETSRDLGNGIAPAGSEIRHSEFRERPRHVTCIPSHVVVMYRV